VFPIFAPKMPLVLRVTREKSYLLGMKGWIILPVFPIGKQEQIVKMLLKVCHARNFRPSYAMKVEDVV